MLPNDAAVSLTEDRRSGLDETVSDGGVSDRARTAVEEAGDASGAADLQSVLEEGPVDELRGVATTSCTDGLNDWQRRRLGGIYEVMTSGVEVGDDARNAVFKGLEFFSRDQGHMLRTWARS